MERCVYKCKGRWPSVTFLASCGHGFCKECADDPESRGICLTCDAELYRRNHPFTEKRHDSGYV